MEFLKIFTSVLCLLFVIHDANGYMVGNNPYHREETIDPRGRYHLTWLVDWNTKTVTFNVTCQTRGYIGFGLTAKGKMQGADIVIGGVRRSGEAYFGDYHAVGNQKPVLDPSQDWKLLGATENASHTFLSFSRPFDTCDEQDYPITEDKITLIWAYSERDDELEYHHQNKGSFDVYLIGPNYVPPVVRNEEGKVVRVLGDDKLRDLKAWTVETDMVIPDDDTTYWCTVQTPPRLNRKHHIVGMEIRYPNTQSQEHVHHATIYRCHNPPGQSIRELFNPLLNYRGNRCFIMFQPVDRIPTQYCTELFWSFTIGGRIFFLPPHVGMPIGEQEEYFVFQMHYDNRNRLPNRRVQASIDWFYTSNLREHDAGVFMVRTLSHALPPTILVPPSTIDQTIWAHCSPDCTRQMLPESGINLVTGWLHSHDSGVRLRVQHFRDGKELPPIIADDNYDNQYQDHRALHRDIKVLPGDQVSTMCVYDSTWARNATVVAGFTTRQEMCNGIMLYYNKMKDYNACTSEIVSEQYRRYFLGFGNVTWSYPPLEYVVDPPQQYAGQTVTQVSDNHVNWTLERRKELRRFHLYHPQVNTCDRVTYIRNAGDRFGGSGEPVFTGRYPVNAIPYKPELSCSFRKH